MRKEKQQYAVAAGERIQGSESLFLINYAKMDANSANSFRGEIEKVGGSYTVFPKRLFLTAAKSVGVALDPKEVKGSLGLISADKNSIDVVKAIYKFSDDNQDLFTVYCGRFEGDFLSSTDCKRLSALPTMDVMRSQFLALLEAPMANVLAVMEAAVTADPSCLKEKQ